MVGHSIVTGGAASTCAARATSSFRGAVHLGRGDDKLPSMLCALLTTLAPPPPTLSSHLHSLETTHGDDLVDSCLRTMHAVPGPRGAALLPANVGELREAAAFFNFGKSDVAGSQQHIFDVSLWDDSLEVLAEAVV